MNSSTNCQTCERFVAKVIDKLVEDREALTSQNQELFLAYKGVIKHLQEEIERLTKARTDEPANYERQITKQDMRIQELYRRTLDQQTEINRLQNDKQALEGHGRTASTETWGANEK